MLSTNNIIRGPEAQNLLGCTAMFLIEWSTIQLRTRQYIPEDSELHIRHSENLISHIEGLSKLASEVISVQFYVAKKLPASNNV
jgi:hypothetical protein